MPLPWYTPVLPVGYPKPAFGVWKYRCCSPGFTAFSEYDGRYGFW